MGSLPNRKTGDTLSESELVRIQGARWEDKRERWKIKNQYGWGRVSHLGKGGKVRDISMKEEGIMEKEL